MTIGVRVREVLHERGEGGAEVTPLELFFDLVYVLAVTQLTHHLLEHLSPRGAVETLVLLLAVWRAWIHVAWTTNYFDLGTRPVRLALLGVMLLSLLMSASIPDAFAERGLVFAAAFFMIQAGWTFFLLTAVGPDHHLAPVFARVLFWEVVGGGLMLVGGLTQGDARLALWLMAVVLLYVAMWLGFPVRGWGRNRTTDYTISGEHMAHRCMLFIILALGESIIITGANFAMLPSSIERVAALVIAFVGSAALWWLYFDRAEEAGRRIISTARDPAALGLSAYTYFHIPMVAGIITVAAGDELSVAEPSAAGSVATTAVVLGGPLLFLLGNALFKWSLWGYVPPSRPVAMATLIVLGPVGIGVPVVILMLAATAVLVALALWDVRAGRLALGSGVKEHR